jgi:hypothetical protein
MRRAARPFVLAGLLALASAEALAQARSTPRPAPPAPPTTPAEPPSADSAYAAYQRGSYLTAFRESTERVEAVADPVSMTLLAELPFSPSA